MKNDQPITSITNYIATVEDIEELMGICIGLLGESQSMSPEDRTIAANLLGDAAAIAADAPTNERARLLRITEAAIGGVAVGDNATIAALFQRHKTELERLRRKAAGTVDAAQVPEPTEGVPAEAVHMAAEESARVASPEPGAAPAARARKRAPERKKRAK